MYMFCMTFLLAVFDDYMYYITFKHISLFVARHLRHFRSEKPTPSLNPPIKFEAGMSPTTHITAP